MRQRAVSVWLCAPNEPGFGRRATGLLTDAGVEVGTSPGGGMPGVLIVRWAGECLDLVAKLSAGRQLVVVVVGPMDLDPWELLDAGAADVLAWGDDGIEAMRSVAARVYRWHEVDRLATTEPVSSRVIGHSSAWLTALRWLVEIARFSDASVLLTGESGTGKELAARLVHGLDTKRNKGKFVVVDCTTIVETLSGPELFGHERGAFTGADTARRGAFAEADGGVLFLDEIGELPPRLQPELLRVLQEKSFKALGSQRWQRTDFRLVCATNRNLVTLERSGAFRRDLLYRLSAATVQLPSLAERVADIPLLARHFLSQLVGAEAPDFDPAVERLLLTRSYPGNVRELRQLVTQIAIRHVGGPLITVGTVPDGARHPEPRSPTRSSARLADSVRDALHDGLDLRALKATVADLAVSIAVAEAGGNLVQAAKRLGVTARALQLRRATAEVSDGAAESAVAG
ncbi:MAG TPA: sigma 54-interacting transcriptional regulator [Actinophytocola sp.]|uniref:sigma 54-interacting transcriptional regulator n=1 Tax=Actinophytocola sp. TaxID=1872138 RepID=UPI002DBE16EB|nr:sigma 54-interacting transcriptional regulator [Actinophytocola sp.]HEU5473662.1 sigma 54-interacting transcriptional regulator [Actinophytocola sp.]